VKGGKSVYYFDMRKLQLSYGQYASLLTVQGIVNKPNDPKFFLVNNNAYFVDTDTEWKKYYEEKMGYKFTKLNSYDEVLVTFKDSFKQIITYSENIKNGWAVPIADAAALISSLSESLPIPTTYASIVSDKTGLPIAQTVTVGSNENKKDFPGNLDKLGLKNPTETYKWIFDNLKDFTAKDQYLSLDSSGLDLAVQRKMMFFVLAPKKSAEDQKLLNEIHDYFNKNSKLFSVWGWVENEDLGVKAIADAGGILKCIGFSNLSFHAVVPVEKPNNKLKQKTGIDIKNVKYDPKKFYVTFMASEADTAKSPATFQYGAWLDKNRGQVPINWGMMPEMYVDFPVIAVKQYTETTKNDYMYTSAQSFMGFTDIGAIPEDSRDTFAEKSKKLMELTDQYLLDLYSDYNVFTKIDTVREVYSNFAKKAGILGFFGRNEIVDSTKSELYPNQDINSSTMRTELIKFPQDVLFIRRPIMYPYRTAIPFSELDPKNVNGQFEIGYLSVDSYGGENFLVAGEKAYDYTYLSTKININSSVKGVVSLRTFISDDQKSYYEYRITDGFKHEIVKVVNSKETILGTKTQAINAKTKYALNFVTNGETVTAYIDNTVIGSFKEGGLKNGKFGLYSKDLDVSFTDLAIADQPIWKERYDAIVTDTIKTGKSGGFSVGFYGYIMSGDYTKAQFSIEAPPYAIKGGASTVTISPTDIKKIIDELNKNYPGKFVFTTMDGFMGAALASQK
jgi:hypothetical protein